MKIEHNIPIPIRGGQGRGIIYQWQDMNIGDSIFVSPINKGRSAKNAFSHYIKKYNPSWKFCSRQEKNGIRIWRIPNDDDVKDKNLKNLMRGVGEKE